MRAAPNQRARPRTGQTAVMFALLIPMVLALGGVVIGIGNWYVHGKNLQTKADAAHLQVERVVVSVRRHRYLDRRPGPAVRRADIGDACRSEPASGRGRQREDPHRPERTELVRRRQQPVLPTAFNSPSGPVCDANILDVKVSEDNSFPLASLLPLFPDIKRKARVRIEESKSASGGLLPIAVRVPKPLSAAAIYVNETPGAGYGQILSARYFRDVCEPPSFTGCVSPMPTALDHWTTDDGSSNGNPADIGSMPSQVGVVVGLSFRPKCPGASPCFNINTGTYPSVHQMCNQGTSALVQCFYATGSSTQAFQSGLQFIRGYNADADPPPDLLSVWLDTPTGTELQRGVLQCAGCQPLRRDAARKRGSRLRRGRHHRAQVQARFGEHLLAGGRCSGELQRQLWC